MERSFNTTSQETGDHLISSTYPVAAPKDYGEDCEIVYQNTTGESSLQSREYWENKQRNSWKTTPASTPMSVNDILQLAFASSKICSHIPETTLITNKAANTENLHINDGLHNGNNHIIDRNYPKTTDAISSNTNNNYSNARHEYEQHENYDHYEHPTFLTIVLPIQQFLPSVANINKIV